MQLIIFGGKDDELKHTLTKKSFKRKKRQASGNYKVCP
jgi:hypothetical protein